MENPTVETLPFPSSPFHPSIPNPNQRHQLHQHHLPEKVNFRSCMIKHNRSRLPQTHLQISIWCLLQIVRETRQIPHTSVLILTGSGSFLGLNPLLFSCSILLLLGVDFASWFGRKPILLYFSRFAIWVGKESWFLAFAALFSLPLYLLKVLQTSEPKTPKNKTEGNIHGFHGKNSQKAMAISSSNPSPSASGGLVAPFLEPFRSLFHKTCRCFLGVMWCECWLGEHPSLRKGARGLRWLYDLWHKAASLWMTIQVSSWLLTLSWLGGHPILQKTAQGPPWWYGCCTLLLASTEIILLDRCIVPNLFSYCNFKFHANFFCYKYTNHQYTKCFDFAFLGFDIALDARLAECYCCFFYRNLPSGFLNKGKISGFKPPYSETPTKNDSQAINSNKCIVINIDTKFAPLANTTNINNNMGLTPKADNSGILIVNLVTLSMTTWTINPKWKTYADMHPSSWCDGIVLHPSFVLLSMEKMLLHSILRLCQFSRCLCTPQSLIYNHICRICYQLYYPYNWWLSKISIELTLLLRHKLLTEFCALWTTTIIFYILSHLYFKKFPTLPLIIICRLLSNE